MGVLLLILLICAVILAVMIFVWAKKVIGNAPDIHVLSFRPQGFATTIYDSAGNLTDLIPAHVAQNIVELSVAQPFGCIYHLATRAADILPYR